MALVSLDDLSNYQDPSILKFLIPPTVLALSGKDTTVEGRRTFDLEILMPLNAKPEAAKLNITWNQKNLSRQYPTIEEDLRLLLNNSSPLGERTVELAAYGLALCALHEWLPGKRVVEFKLWQAPDLVLTVDKNIGVEVAGRGRGGRAVLRSILEPDPAGKTMTQRLGKREGLRRVPGFDELYICLWVLGPAIGHFERVR